MSKLFKKKTQNTPPPEIQAYLTRISKAEKSNEEITARIEEITNKIQQLQTENQKLKERKKSHANTKQNSEQMQREIEECKEYLSKSEHESKKALTEISAIANQFSPLEEQRLELLHYQDKILGLRDDINDVDQQFRESRKKTQSVLDNLLVLDRQKKQFEGYEWLEQKKSMLSSIEEFNKIITTTDSETSQIKKQLYDMNRQKDTIIILFEKWRGKVDNVDVPPESIDELMAQLNSKTKDPPKDIENLKLKLQDAIRENDELQMQIDKEKRANGKRFKGIQQLLVEIKKQEQEIRERAQLEEKRLMQRIIAAKDQH